MVSSMALLLIGVQDGRRVCSTQLSESCVVCL